jgi:hypothetical protein
MADFTFAGLDNNSRDVVAFLSGVSKQTRTAFGRNGKGRYSPFCSADSYTVSTVKHGELIEQRIRLFTTDCQNWQLQV